MNIYSQALILFGCIFVAKDRGQVLQMLKEGTQKAREIAAKTTDEVKAAIGLKHF